MRDLRTIQIPKITDGIKFQYLCRDIWKNNNDKFDLVEINGRPGQAQDGVDIFGREIINKKWFGIQCKVRSDNNKLHESEIRDEIAKALDFNPSLNKYILITTLNRDVNLQELMRYINSEQKYKFMVEILFWEDIEELLKEEANFNIYYKYYQSYFADSRTLGYSIGKLINLKLGTGHSIDTCYELMIGKIPAYQNKTGRVDYYRDIYFIVNFHERKMETFKIPCFESDIEMAFSNRYDRFRITRWLKSINDLDSYLFSAEDSVESYISIDEDNKYIESLNEDT